MRFFLRLGRVVGNCRGKRTRTPNPSSGGGQRPASNAILSAGTFIILINLLLFAVFLIQIGGFDKITVLSYTDYIDFLTYEDPRFLFTFVQFLPVGLLLVYVGLSSRKAVRRNLFYLDVSSILYIGWLTLIGARGPAFLFAMGVLYVRHICYRRLSKRVVAAAAVTFLGRFRSSPPTGISRPTSERWPSCEMDLIPWLGSWRWEGLTGPCMLFRPSSVQAELPF